MKRAVILLAHGSRDPLWRRPVESLRRALARKLGRGVVTAYLEFTRPSLESQVASLAQRGYRDQRIVPVFLGSGRHLKRDVARKAIALRRKHKIRINVDRALGEQPAVIAALAAALGRKLR